MGAFLSCKWEAHPTYFGPNVACRFRIIDSSAADQFPFLMLGRRWFRHRSRHCLPVRFEKRASTFARPATRVQFHLSVVSSAR